MYVPAVAKLTVLLVAPGAIEPVSNATGAPASDVAVCATGSAFCQVMFSPGEIVAVGRAKAKLRMATVWLAPSAAFGSRASAAMTVNARRNGLLRRIR